MDPFRVRNHMETYYGQVKSPSDAVILFEACRQGTLPRVQRRLSEKERQQIRSGSVFVWDEREAGMRRWTDGKSWSASRVSGSFLTYREMEGKRGGGSNGGSPGPSAPLEQTTSGGSDPADGMDGYRYKPDGLVKQSFSISTSAGQHLHLISYFARSHPASANIPSPTSDPNLRHIRPAKGMYPESTVHDAQNMPAVTRSPMGESSGGDGANGYMRHAPPPQFGFPPTPGTPPAMNAPWPGSYFPYGFPPGGFPGMPNGIPAAWAAAWFAQMQMWQQQQQQMQQSQQQNQPQNQQQGQQQTQNGGSNSFDRAQPPLRGNPPPPPPAPAQSYPHLQHQNSQSGSGSSHTPYISPLRNGEQTPSYQNSTTFQAHQAQYQAWLERQKHTAETPQQNQRSTTTLTSAPTQQQPQGMHTNGYSAHGYGPVQNGYSASQQTQPQSQSQAQGQASVDTPQRPALQHTTSSESVHSTAENDTSRKIIPSINTLMASQRDQRDQRNTAPAPSASQSHPQPQPQPQPRPSQNYPYAKISPAPPSNGYQRPAEGQPTNRMPDSQEPGAGNGGQGGYGADMNALRRLDRAFAP